MLKLKVRKANKIDAKAYCVVQKQQQMLQKKREKKNSYTLTSHVQPYTFGDGGEGMKNEKNIDEKQETPNKWKMYVTTPSIFKCFHQSFHLNRKLTKSQTRSSGMNHFSENMNANANCKIIPYHKTRIKCAYVRLNHSKAIEIYIYARCR